MLTEATKSSSYVSVRAITSGPRVRSRTYNPTEFFKKYMMLTLRMQHPSNETERFETEVLTGGSARGSPRAPPPRQKLPFGSGGESQLQILVSGAAHAALPKEGAAHLLPSGRGRYRNAMVHQKSRALRGSLTGHRGIAIWVATRTQ